MSTELNEQDLALIQPKNFGHVATVAAGGAPHSIVVWIDEHGGVARFNSGSTSAHIKHLQRDPRVALSVHDQENPYRAVTLVGTARLVADRADEHLDELTRKYTDMDRFPDDWRVPGARRLTVEVVPERVLRYGY